jgi:thiopeptide-type bacteriocin biosynthesis protein
MTETSGPTGNAGRDERLRAARAWRPSRQDWRAWHVFLHESGALESLLVDAVLPEFRALGERPDVQAFYIRYWENGSHIRVRVRGLEDASFLALGDRLRTQAAAIARDLGPAPDRYPEGMQFDGWHSDPAGLAWFSPGSVVEIIYEPEARRYGGRHGLVVNEQIFIASSALALAIVEKTRDAPGRRQRIALGLTAAAIGVVAEDRDALTTFLTAMSGHWANFSGDLKVAREAAQQGFNAAQDELVAMVHQMLNRQPGDSRNPLLDRWAAMLAEYFDELRELAGLGLLIHPLTGVPPDQQKDREHALQNIMLSQIHMMNNRLGIFPWEEFQFANMLLAALALV